MSNHGTPLKDVARMLNQGPQKFYEELRAKKILDNRNLPYRRYVTQGLLGSELKKYTHPTMGDQLYATPFATAKGIEWLAGEFGVPITNADQQPKTGTEA